MHNKLGTSLEIFKMSSPSDWHDCYLQQQKLTIQNIHKFYTLRRERERVSKEPAMAATAAKYIIVEIQGL